MARVDREVWRLAGARCEAWAGGLRVLGVPGTTCSPHIFDCLGGWGVEVLAVPWLEWSPPHTMEALGAVLAGLAEQYRPVVLVGHSTGGVIALSAALKAGEGAIAGVVVCDSGANMAGHGDVATILAQVQRQWGPWLWRRIAERSVARCPGEEVMAMLAGYPARLASRAVVEALESQRDTDLLPYLPRLESLPVLVVHGRRDGARPLAHGEALAAALPAGELTVLDCGHTPPVELPAVFAATVARWLTRLPAHTTTTSQTPPRS